MHVQNLVGESPLHFPLSSLPLCSPLHTNFSINQHINWLPLIVFFIVLYFLASRRKFQSLPGCFLWPVWYEFSILLNVFLVRVFDHRFHSLHYFQSQLYIQEKSKYSFLNFLLLCFRTINSRPLIGLWALQEVIFQVKN